MVGRSHGLHSIIDNNPLSFTVSLGFFDDILIPPAVLQHPSRFEETEQAWVWEYPVEDGSNHDLYMDIGETIKFRVTNEIFEETSPVGGPNSDSKTQSNDTVKTPYKILVSTILHENALAINHLRLFQGAINEPGLGVIRWWDNPTTSATDIEGDDEEMDGEVFNEEEDNVDL